jgi:hypothetical protein
MKTQISPKKTVSSALIGLFFLSQQLFAQKQNLADENNEPTHNVTFVLCVLLFIIGFAALIVLKRRDDNKEKKPDQAPRQHAHPHHRNHYGHGHQYHH